MKLKVMKVVAVWGGVVCALSMMVTGCGSAPAENVEIVSDEADRASDVQTDESAENIGRAGIDAVQGDTAQQDMADETNNEETQGNSEGRWHVFSPEVAKVVDADFAGVVWKIDSDSFYIAEDSREVFEDGSIAGSCLSPGAQIPDSDLIQVIFGGDTRFYIRNIYDQGSRYEDEEAQFQDLEQYDSVELKGEFTNDVFHADEIRIVKVV